MTMPSNPYYHLEDSTGRLVQLPTNARFQRVSISLGREIHATPDSDVWWTVGRKRIKPYFLQISFVQQGITEDDVRLQLTDLFDAGMDGVRLWRDHNWAREIESGIDFDVSADWADSSLLRVTITVAPKGPYWVNADSEARSVI